MLLYFTLASKGTKPSLRTYSLVGRSMRGRIAMSEGVATQERRKRATKNCQHRWVIETPHGATSRGLCRRCGATKRFPNAPEQPIWGFAGGNRQTGRWANRRKSNPQELRLPDEDQ